MCNSNGHFFQRISTQPKAVLRVLGVFGVAKELRAPTSPPPTPPGVGGWGTTAGASPRPLPGAACGSGCLHDDAPMWCDGRRRNGRTGRYTIRAQRDDSSAPEIPVPDKPLGYPLDFNCHQRLSTKSTITLPSWAFKFAQKVILSAELAHGATSCTWGWPMGPTGARGGGGL